MALIAKESTWMLKSLSRRMDGDIEHSRVKNSENSDENMGLGFGRR